MKKTNCTFQLIGRQRAALGISGRKSARKGKKSKSKTAVRQSPVTGSDCEYIVLEDLIINPSCVKGNYIDLEGIREDTHKKVFF